MRRKNKEITYKKIKKENLPKRSKRSHVHCTINESSNDLLIISLSKIRVT